MSDSGSYGKTKVCAGIVGYADLTAGDWVTPVLEAQISAPAAAGFAGSDTRRLRSRPGDRQQRRPTSNPDSICATISEPE